MNLLVNVATCAGAAHFLGSPIGAIGGAVYGGIWTVTKLGSEELMECEEGGGILSTALSVVAAWKLAELCGVDIPLGLAAFSSAASIVVSGTIGISIVLAITGLAVGVIGCLVLGKEDCSDKQR